MFLYQEGCGWIHEARVTVMEGKNRERWLELCLQAANEQDEKKFMALIQEINHLLDKKEERLRDQKKEGQ